MKYITLFLLFFLQFPCKSDAQKINKLKDYETTGRSVLYKDCVENIKVTIPEIEAIRGSNIDIKGFCDCYVDIFASTFDINEMPLSENRYIKFLQSAEIQNCLSNNEVLNITPEERKEIFNGCKNVLLSQPGSVYTEKSDDICDCFIEEYSGLYSNIEIDTDELLDPATYERILLSCSNKIIYSEQPENNEFKPDNVIGNKEKEEISLNNFYGDSLLTKIEIGEKYYYFLVDTGASDLVINKEIEQHLLSKGLINEDSYLGQETYSVADRRRVSATVLIINDVKIGDYKVNNVKAVILDTELPLLGMSFLKKFKDWKINKDEKKLILYK